MKKFLPCLFGFIFLVFLSACDKKPMDNRPILSIKTDPAGANVFISGKECGKTGIKVKLNPGFHLVKVEKNGYEPLWTGINLASGNKKELNLKLNPITSSIMLRAISDVSAGKKAKTKQVAADVIFEGKSYGQTPLVINNLKTGQYSASIKAPGYAQTEVSWVIDSKRPQMKIVKLVSNTGVINVLSGPKNATVTINDTLYGNVPCEIPLEQGEYTVKVSAPGYMDFTRDVSLNSNSKVTVQPVLSELPGTLVINSVPEGAAVTINGKPYGSAPLTVKDLKAGNVKIEFSMKGFDTEVQECGVAPGQTLQVTGKLVSSLGGIQFVTAPAGVTIYLNNKQIGISEPDPDHKGISKIFRIDGLSPGRYTLSFFHKLATPSRRSLDVTVEKNKVKRLEQNVELWIANARIVHNIGSEYIGRIISENEDSIKFERKPGSIINYKRSELKTIERFSGRE